MSDLASIRPAIEAALKQLNVRLAAGDRAGAMRGLNELANRMIHTQRPDISAACYLLPGRTISLTVCRIPAVPRPDRPIAVFVPGLGASLLLAAVHALALLDRFDIVVCSLPGHSGSDELPDVSLAGFSDECAALIAAAMPGARNLFGIGQSLGGLIALELAHRCPNQVKHVILLDPPRAGARFVQLPAAAGRQSAGADAQLRGGGGHRRTVRAQPLDHGWHAAPRGWPYLAGRRSGWRAGATRPVFDAGGECSSVVRLHGALC